MIISSQCYVQRDVKEVEVRFPDLSTTKCLIPVEVTVQACDNEYTPQPDKTLNISLIMHQNQAQIFNHQKAFFHMDRTVNLRGYQSVLNNGGEVRFSIRNFSDERSHYLISLKYEKSYGNIIYQNTHDCGIGEDRIFREVAKSGHCTQLYLIFTRPIEKTEIVSNLTRNDEENVDDDEWFTSLELGATDDDNAYILDFTDPELKHYPRYLNLLTLRVPKESLLSEHGDLKVHIVAYGFANSR